MGVSLILSGSSRGSGGPLCAPSSRARRAAGSRRSRHDSAAARASPWSSSRPSRGRTPGSTSSSRYSETPPGHPENTPQPPQKIWGDFGGQREDRGLISSPTYRKNVPQDPEIYPWGPQKYTPSTPKNLRWVWSYFRGDLEGSEGVWGDQVKDTRFDKFIRIPQKHPLGDPKTPRDPPKPSPNISGPPRRPRAARGAGGCSSRTSFPRRCSGSPSTPCCCSASPNARVRGPKTPPDPKKHPNPTKTPF